LKSKFSLPLEKDDKMPKIISVLDEELLKHLFGGKHGLFLTSMQAKYFEFASFVDDKKLSLYFALCFDELLKFADELGMIMTQAGSVPNFASGDGIWLSGSQVENIISLSEIKVCFLNKLEELQIESMLVEKQIKIVSLKKLCKKICLSCKKLKSYFKN